MCMVDSIDGFAVHLLKEFDVQKLKSETKEGGMLGKKMRRTSWTCGEPSSNHLVNFMKEVLGDTVGKVIVTESSIHLAF